MLFSASACVYPTRHRLALLAAAGTLGVAGLVAASAVAATDDVTPPPPTVTTASGTSPDTPAPVPDPAPKTAPKKKTTTTPVSHSSTTKQPVQHSTPVVVHSTPPAVQPYVPVVPSSPTPATSRATVAPAPSASHQPSVHRARAKRHRVSSHPARPKSAVHSPKAPVRTTPKRKSPLTAPLSHATTPAGAPTVRSSKTVMRLTLLTLISLAAFFLGLAAVPLSTLRQPRVMPVADRVRPVFGAVGISLLGAVAVIYLLGGRPGA